MEDPGANALFADVTRWAGERGLNLVGAIASEVFDASQPCGRRATEVMRDCDTLLLLGTGGRSGWQALSRGETGPPGAPRPGYHPIDDWSRGLAEELLENLRISGFDGRVVMPDERVSPNLRQLGEMVGLGTVSPVIGHFLHPEFGPWVSFRAVLMLSGRPFGDLPAAPTSWFQPCASCHRPCIAPCPVQTYDGDGAIQLGRCADHRHGGGCQHGCDVLRACPVGRAHRYGEEEESFRHAYAGFRIAEARKPGWRRVVSGLLRRMEPGQ